MTIYKFNVEERPVPFSHFHGWVAIDENSRDEIPLPDGGNGNNPGYYPEIEGYLKKKYSLSVDLHYFGIRGDTLEIETGVHATFTFSRGNDKIIVRDIPRKIFGITITRP